MFRSRFCCHYCILLLSFNFNISSLIFSGASFADDSLHKILSYLKSVTQKSQKSRPILQFFEKPSVENILGGQWCFPAKIYCHIRNQRPRNRGNQDPYYSFSKKLAYKFFWGANCAPQLKNIVIFEISDLENPCIQKFIPKFPHLDLFPARITFWTTVCRFQISFIPMPKCQFG